MRVPISQHPFQHLLLLSFSYSTEWDLYSVSKLLSRYAGFLKYVKFPINLLQRKIRIYFPYTTLSVHLTFQQNSKFSYVKINSEINIQCLHIVNMQLVSLVKFSCLP